MENVAGASRPSATAPSNDRYVVGENVAFEYAAAAPEPAAGSASKKKKKKKNKKAKSAPTENRMENEYDLAPSDFASPQSIASMVASSSGSSKPSKNDKIWDTSSSEERARIKQFWQSLSESRRRDLVRIEKDAVLQKMKEQQKHHCSCPVCGRKRRAIEEELNTLYNSYYSDLERQSGTLLILPNPDPNEGPGQEELDAMAKESGGRIVTSTEALIDAARAAREKGKDSPPDSQAALPPADLKLEFEALNEPLQQYSTPRISELSEELAEYDEAVHKSNYRKVNLDEKLDELATQMANQNLAAQPQQPNLPHDDSHEELYADEYHPGDEPGEVCNCAEHNHPHMHVPADSERNENKKYYLPQEPDEDLFNFGDSLAIQGGILTLADDLLKNDGKKFIEMMEQLAERRMAREEEVRATDAAYMSYRRSQGADTDDYDSAEDDESYDEGDEDEHDCDHEFDDEDEEDYDDENDDDHDDDDLDDPAMEERRMLEGRKMLQVFAARMFEQRVLQAYREKVAADRQQKLLEELEEESRLEQEREAKRQKDKEKKKDKKRQQKLAKEEERLRKEAEKLEMERHAQEERQRKLEQAKQRKQEAKLKEEAAKKLKQEKLEMEKRKRIENERKLEQEAEKKRAAQKLKLEQKAKKEAEAKARIEEAARQKSEALKEVKPEKAAEPVSQMAQLQGLPQAQQQQQPAKHPLFHSVLKDNSEETVSNKSLPVPSHPPQQPQLGLMPGQTASQSPMSPSQLLNHMSSPQPFMNAHPLLAQSQHGSPPGTSLSTSANSSDNLARAIPNNVSNGIGGGNVGSLGRSGVSPRGPPPGVGASQIPQSLHQGIHQGLPQGVPQGVAQGVSQAMSQGLAQGVSPSMQPGLQPSMQQGIHSSPGLMPMLSTWSPLASIGYGSMPSPTPRFGAPTPIQPPMSQQQQQMQRNGSDPSALLDMSSMVGGSSLLGTAPGLQHRSNSFFSGGASMQPKRSLWGNDLSGSDTNEKIRKAAVTAYRANLSDGWATDGYVPVQALYQSTCKELSEPISLADFYAACDQNLFDCLRDNVGLITHMRYRSEVGSGASQRHLSSNGWPVPSF